MISRSEFAMEQVGPCHAVTRIVDDIILRRGMHPTLPALFLESKALELMSSWLCHLGHLETNHRPARPTVNQRTRKRVAIVKEMLDRSPALALNIELLEKAAAMNRTKLRAAFKQMYGMTLVQYRTAVSMRRAEQLLGEAGATVQEAAQPGGIYKCIELHRRIQALLWCQPRATYLVRAHRIPRPSPTRASHHVLERRCSISKLWSAIGN
jgi:AraC-like DNA-binding protein